MEWNLEASALIKLLDDEIVEIDIDNGSAPRCTCEICYNNRILTQAITAMFKDGDKVTCTIEDTIKYVLDKAKLIRFFANNTENFAKMTRYEFCTFLKRLEKRKLSDMEIWQIYGKLI